jgi:hypothetical protein
VAENEAYHRSTSSSNPARRRRKPRTRNGNNTSSDGHNYPTSSDHGNDPAVEGGNDSSGKSKQDTSNKTSKSKRNRGAKPVTNKNGKVLPKKEADPYDSDPGESYRDHCERIQDNRSRSCLAMPRFLKDGKFNLAKHNSIGNASSSGVKVLHNGGPDDKSGATSPPSPLISEPDSSSLLNPLDPKRQQGGNTYTPASLPHDLARVRYSLRTSVGDGTDVQPGGSASMMERRELRPNNIHINVSHWSDFGGRNYMEDRCVLKANTAVRLSALQQQTYPSFSWISHYGSFRFVSF